MLGPRTQIVQLFIITGFFITVETYGIVVLEDSDLKSFGKNNYRANRPAIDGWLEEKLKEKGNKSKRELNVLSHLKNLIKKYAQKHENNEKIGDTRDYSMEDIINNYGRTTKKDCIDVFGNPRECKIGKIGFWSWQTRSLEPERDSKERRKLGPHFVMVDKTRSNGPFGKTQTRIYLEDLIRKKIENHKKNELREKNGYTRDYSMENILNNNGRTTTKDCSDVFGNPQKCKIGKTGFWSWQTRSLDSQGDDERRQDTKRNNDNDRRQFGAHFPTIERMREQEAVDETQKRFDVIDNNEKQKPARTRWSSIEESEKYESSGEESPYDIEDKTKNNHHSTDYETAESPTDSESREYIPKPAIKKERPSRNRLILNKPIVKPIITYSSLESREKYYSEETTEKPLISDESSEEHLISEEAITPKKSKSKRKKQKNIHEDLKSDDNILYLQGSRLYQPETVEKLRRFGENRLPYFLPKKYDWDEDMLHDLDTFWHGINSKNYEKSFWYRAK